MGMASVKTVHPGAVFDVNHADKAIFIVKEFYISFLHRKSLGHEGPDCEQGTQRIDQKKKLRGDRSTLRLTGKVQYNCNY